jgi:phosphatidylglycerol---prolipoprotein diacylglyceryl transferase
MGYCAKFTKHAQLMIIHWNFDPILFSLGPIQARWYGILFVGGFFVGQWILARMFVSEGVPRDRAERLLLILLLGAIIGARLVHCLFYDPHYYLAHPIEILKVWEGGLASHGGAIGMLVALWLAQRKMNPRLPYLWLVDRIATTTALGAVFIRTANFLNSEIIGRPTSGTWGVVFERVDNLPRHPVQLYEAIAYLLIFVVLMTMYSRKGTNTPHGLLFGWFMVLVFVARFVLEFFKVPQAAYEAHQAITVGQYLSVPFIVLGAVMIWRAIRHPTSGTGVSDAGVIS